jgi:stalled ribosome rescue protein Dom34
MKKEVGLWIDRRRAAIVTVKDGDMEMRQVVSDIDKQDRSGGAQDFPEEDIMERRLENHLKKYYDEVISNIHDAQSILIFGPGEAKIELKKRIDGKSFIGKKIHIETEDKMTDNQITAKVKRHFNKENNN